jgi:sec-independent protein translocase protein TatB
MLNVGPLELLVVLAVALIVVGPERLPELARAVGRAVRQLRDVQNEVRDMVSMGVDDEVRQAASEFKKATGDLRKATDVRGAVRRAERELGDEPEATPSGTTVPATEPEPVDRGNGRADPAPVTEEPEAVVERSDEPPGTP